MTLILNSMATCLGFYHTMYVKAFITLCLPMGHIWFNKSFELLIKMDIFSLKILEGKCMTNFTLNFNNFMNSPKHISLLPNSSCTEVNILGELFIVTGTTRTCPVYDLFSHANETK